MRDPGRDAPPFPGARLEDRLRTAGLVVGPAAALLLYVINPGGHPPEARRLIAVLTLTIAFWVTEAIPLPATALLASALCIVLGVAPVRAVLAPYADPVIFLFVGSFLMAEAFQKYGLDRMVAARMLGTGRFARSLLGRLLGIGGASALASTCLSNTATAAMMTPIAVGAARRDGALAATGSREPTAEASGMLLMVAYGASIGGMATLIGTPPNLLVAGYLERLCGVRVGFVPWLLFGLPIAIVLFVVAILWTRLVVKRGVDRQVSGAHPPAAIGTGPDAAVETVASPWTARGAAATIVVFVLAGVLWSLPSIARLALGRDHRLVLTLEGHLPEAGVALLCATLLFVTPLDWRRRRFALSWEEGKRVNWGIILLFGGGLSLGTLAESTGVAHWVGQGLRTLGLARSGAGLLFCAVALTIVVSEFASNTAAATLLVPMVIAAAQASGLDPVRPALGVGLAATCGFIFPVSTPPNAIVYGTGLVPLHRMIRSGLLLDLTALIVVWGGLILLTPLLPR